MKRTPKCKHQGKPILKFGGLLCPQCRVILHTPSEPEYRKAWLAEVKRLEARGKL